MLVRFFILLSFVFVSCAGQLHGMDGFYDFNTDCAHISRRQRVQEETNEKKLWRAVADGKIDQVKELLKIGGIDLECKGIYRTVLTTAAKEGNAEIVQLLLDNHANPKALSNFRDTPLHEAALAHSTISNKNADYPKVIELLLKAGVDANVPNYMGVTPLHNSVNCMFNRADKSIKAALCKQLLLAGAHRHCQFNASVGIQVGYTPLHMAVDYNNPLAVQELIIFEPTSEELQHLIPGAWALKQLNFPADLQEIIKRKMVSSVVTDQVALAHAYMAMTASGKTAYTIAKEKGFADVAHMLDMSNNVSRAALRHAVVIRIRELLNTKKNEPVLADLA